MSKGFFNAGGTLVTAQTVRPQATTNVTANSPMTITIQATFADMAEEIARIVRRELDNAQRRQAASLRGALHDGAGY